MFTTRSIGLIKNQVLLWHHAAELGNKAQSVCESSEGHTLKTLVVEGHVHLQDSHSLICIDCKDEPFPCFML